ncbi:MAG: hypothetical protein JXQ27_09810 [Acidobacteria bacterium]|nr:hypothetical protein [Acidobacteriota bacterium]
MIQIAVLFSSLEKEADVRHRITFPLQPDMQLEYLSTAATAPRPAPAVNGACCGRVMVIASGGTEELIRDIITHNRQPVLLLANPVRNSLAAAMEAYAVLKKDHPVKLAYAEHGSAAEQAEIARFAWIARTLHHLRHARLGCIGPPSDWLLTSRGITDFGHLGTELVSIPVEDLLQRMRTEDTPPARELTREYRHHFSCRDVEAPAVEQAARLALALEALVADHRLDAVTVRCFDLLEHGLTACLGVSRLNDAGIPTGCEGDLPAALTLMTAERLTAQPAWMANPARLNVAANTVTLAHCTVPARMLEERRPMTIRPHMESGQGTALEGNLRKGFVTLLRFSSAADSLLIAPAELESSGGDDPDICRTRAMIRLEGSVLQWLEHSPGNHQIMIYGHHQDMLMDFCRLGRIRPVLIA